MSDPVEVYEEYDETQKNIRGAVRLRLAAEDDMDDDTRYEIHEGVAYAMSQPSSDHQIIQDELTQQLKRYFRDKNCQTMQASFGVDFTAFMESGKETLYQPDVTVIYDRNKLDRKTGTYYGAPSLVVEVSSPSTRSRDLDQKKHVYERAGVPAYLFVEDRYSASLFVLENGRYTETVYEARENQDISIPVVPFPGLRLEIKQDWFWFSDGADGE